MADVGIDQRTVSVPDFQAQDLASPLEGGPASLGASDNWQIEWKWDGIRAQLIRRNAQCFIWSRGEDLFLILDSARGDGSITVKALINPLVNLLWIGALVFVLGSLITAWPDRREARRLARRYAEEPVVGEA